MNIIFPYCALAGAIYASIKSIGVEADEDVEVCFFKDVVDAGKVAVTQYVGGQPQKYFPANHFIAMNVTQQLHHWLHILARLNYLNTGDIDIELKIEARPKFPLKEQGNGTSTNTVGVIKICSLVFRELLSLGCINLQNLCAHH